MNVVTGIFIFFIWAAKFKVLVQNFRIEAKTVLVIFNAFFDARGFAIRNHEDLFVDVLAPAKNVHRQLSPATVLCDMASLVNKQVFDFDWPRVIAKD